jgi:hypothetical protein
MLCSHGTAVSGIIAGLKGNNICTVGVAYNASILGKIPNLIIRLMTGEYVHDYIIQTMAGEHVLVRKCTTVTLRLTTVD